MHRGVRLKQLFLSVGIAAFVFGSTVHATQPQGSDPGAVELVRQAVASELQANRTDKSVWEYRENDITDGRNAVYQTIETPQGSLRRLIELNGHPLSPEAAANETRRIQNYVHDPSAQARARRGSNHDDAQAEELLKMLPNAFIWT
ncbi:MAG TPA: hypothetical protein VGM11_06275, partial [Acidobacteriaceae bacterium]